MSIPLTDSVFDIGRDLQNAYDEGYRQGRYDEKAEGERKAGRWIPCSERLPEAKGHKPYLITEAHYDPECIGRFVEIDWYDARDDERVPSWDDHEEKDGIRVVAWMPLPEPYKGGE